MLASGDREIWHLDPYAREISASTGNSVVYTADFDWAVDSFSMPPWNELVIYELHVGTFNDLRRDQPGNLDGAIAKLPYLRDLGVNAVEVMPPMEFARRLLLGLQSRQPVCDRARLRRPEWL